MRIVQSTFVEARFQQMDVPEVSIDELESALAAGAHLLDVRETAELAEARVSGGQHIALGDIPDQHADVPTGQPVYVICAVGGRSRAAADYLRQFDVDAINVAGGTKAWVAAGKPFDTDF